MLGAKGHVDADIQSEQSQTVEDGGVHALGDELSGQEPCRAPDEYGDAVEDSSSGGNSLEDFKHGENFAP